MEHHQSLFIDQVEDGNVARVSVGQNEIRYQLKTVTLLGLLAGLPTRTRSIAMP